MDGYTYDELVRLHEQMTWQVNHLTVEGLVEFRVNQHKGRIEVLVDGPYDHGALNALVAGIPRDAYKVLETAGAGEGFCGQSCSPATAVGWTLGPLHAKKGSLAAPSGGYQGGCCSALKLMIEQASSTRA